MKGSAGVAGARGRAMGGGGGGTDGSRNWPRDEDVAGLEFVTGPVVGLALLAV